MGLISLIRLRSRRRYFLARAWRRRRQLTPVADRTASLSAQPILLFSTMRNERIRLPYFLAYYRRLGVNHFLIVDNGSDDGTRDFLAEQSDVSVWSATAGYKQSRFGMDWMMHLLRRHGHGR